MKVYLVIDHDIESDEVLGVFSSRAAAEQAKAARRDDKTLGSLAWAWNDAVIEEWDVEDASAPEAQRPEGTD